MASCAPPRLIYPICVSTNPLQFQFHTTPQISNLFCLYNAIEILSHSMPMTLSHWQKIEITFAIEIFHVYTDLTGATYKMLSCFCHGKTPNLRGWIIYITCHRLGWFLCSQRPIILLLFAGGEMRHFLSDRPPFWFRRGEKHHVNLMCPAASAVHQLGEKRCLFSSL